MSGRSCQGLSKGRFSNLSIMKLCLMQRNTHPYNPVTSCAKQRRLQYNLKHNRNLNYIWVYCTYFWHCMHWTIHKLMVTFTGKVERGNTIRGGHGLMRHKSWPSSPADFYADGCTDMSMNGKRQDKRRSHSEYIGPTDRTIGIGSNLELRCTERKMIRNATWKKRLFSSF